MISVSKNLLAGKKSLVLVSLLVASVLFTACGGGGGGNGSSSSSSSSTSSSSTGSSSGNQPVFTSPSAYSIVTGDDKLKSFTLTTGENVIYPSGNPAFRFDLVEGTADVNEDTGNILMSTVTDSTIKVTATRVSDDANSTPTNVVSDPFTITFTALNPATITVKKPMSTGADSDPVSSIDRSYTKNADGLDNVTGPNGLVWGDNVINAKPEASDTKTYLGAIDFCQNLATPDFRLPTLNEMLDLIDYSKPPFKAGTNDNSMIGGVDNEFDFNLINVWVEKQFERLIFVSENAGIMTYNNDGSEVAVRCVKGDRSDEVHLVYTELVGGSTIDVNTGLEWAKPSSSTMKVVAGETYCVNLGNGYRMPSINELRSIVEDGTVSPSVTGGNRQLTSNTPYIDSNGTIGGAAGDANWMLVLREDGTIDIGAGNDAVSINCVRDLP